MKTRCDSCPCDADVECLSYVPQFANFCELAASGDPVKREHVANRSRIAKDGPLPKGPCADSSLPSIAEQRRLQAIAKKCPHRVTNEPCGCGMAICRLEKGEGLDKSKVSLRECMACVAATESETPASQPTGS